MKHAPVPPKPDAAVAETPPDPPREKHRDLNRMAVRPRLGSFLAEFLGWGFIDGTKWWRNYLHVHTYYEICYAFRGRGLFRMLGTEYAVRGGDLFIAKPREEHEIVSSSDDPLGIYFWSYTLTPDLKRGAQAAASPDAALDGLLHAFIGSRHWVSRRVPGMLRTLELLSEEAARSEPGFTAAVEGLAAKLVLDTARAGVGGALPGERAAPRVSDPGAGLCEQALRYMRDNLGRALAVHEIAAQVNVSARHFTRLFTQRHGASPLDALTAMRVETAAQLLLDPALPVKEIAERVGYPDVRYFTTVFRKQTGLPPAAYRARGGTRFQDPAREARRKPGHVERRKRKRGS